MILVDVGETTAKFRYLYKRIKDNTDFSKAEALRDQLDQLKKEESLPDALEAEDTLASMLLDSASRACKWYNDKTIKIDSDLRSAERSKNPYTALMCAVEADRLLLSPPDRFQYSTEQLDELNGYIAYSKKIAALAFSDGWIRSHRCTSTDKLLSYQNFSSKAGELFNHYGFVKESIELSTQVAKEVERVKMVIAREALYKNSVSFVATSVIRPGATKKVLSGNQKQGQSLINEYSFFDYEQDKNFVTVYGQLQARLAEIDTALKALKQQQDALWDGIYSISSTDDVRHIIAQLQALLNSGLEDDDRADFEEIDTFLRQFLVDIEPLEATIESRDRLEEIRHQLLESYNEDSELSMEELIEMLVSDQHSHIDELEKEWKAQYLYIDINEYSQAELDQWKKDTQPLPLYISDKTKQEYIHRLEKVEALLSKAKKDYILYLFDQLSEAEKDAVRKQLMAK